MNRILQYVRSSLSIKLGFILLVIFLGQFTSASDYGFFLVQQMGRGLNLGNTLEAPYEGWWDIAAAEYMIDDYANAGFTCVRIPTRWDEHTDSLSPYTVDAAWLNRVEEIVDGALSRDLYVVLNSHHDEWIGDFTQANRDRFQAIWQQVAYHFRNKSDHLIFEVLNEPFLFFDSADDTDTLMQETLDTIRISNPTRYVVITGGCTEDFWITEPLFKITSFPDDPYLIATFHYYPNSTLYEYGWGSDSQKDEIDQYFDEVAAWSKEHNLPILLGEFGATTTADQATRVGWDSYIAKAAVDRGFAFTIWEHEGPFEVYHQDPDERTWNQGILDGLITSGIYPDLSIPHNPSPANNAVAQPLSGITLQWDTALSEEGIPNPEITGHFLYYHLNSDNLNNVTPILIDAAEGDPGIHAQYELLETFSYDDTIYWQIEEQINNAQAGDALNITGPIWRFDVLDTKPVIDNQPKDVVAQIGDTVTLTLQAHDPVGGGSIEYQWYQSESVGDTANPTGVRDADPDLHLTIERRSDLNQAYWCRVFRNSAYIDSRPAWVNSLQLIAYYPMDAIVPYGLEDVTGNGYNGHFGGVGSISLVFDGSIDNAIHLNEGRYFNIDEKIMHRPDMFTVSAWIRLDPDHDDAETICMWKEITGNEAFLLVNDNHQLEYVQETPSWEGVGTWWNAPALNSGQWHHVALTFNYQTARLYIDGVSNWSGTMDDYNGWGSVDTYFSIGRPGYGDNSAFEGDIDDFRIYNNALSASQVQQIYQQGQPYCFAEFDLAGDDCIVTIDDLAVFAAQWLDVYAMPDLADLADQWQKELLGTP